MPELGAVTPILRIFDVAKAREFYLDFLGFAVTFEHRFEPDLPLYMGIARDGCVLHLSEHYGDACPGSAVRISVRDIEALHADLLGQRRGFARPGLETAPWNSREIRLTDPFGNRVTFFENLPD
ncbi:MAG: glyoxalase superfamily protein [Rhizobiaceae bacterium]